MSTLKDLVRVLAQARKQVKATKDAELFPVEIIVGSNDNAVYFGDNLKVLNALVAEGSLKGKVQLIYIDPPFFSKQAYDASLNVSGKMVSHPAFNDRWENGLYGYIRDLAARLMQMRELLSDDGLIFLHLDWHVVHYARILMDEIFGEKRFVNEIIWNYKSGGSTKKHFARKHDNILVYSKTAHYKFHPLKEKSYNREFKPYRFKGVEEFCDEVGWYTMVNMKDVWNIDMVGRTSEERTGYATQKPEKLLERILESCTDPGDLVADFFCGSGTLPAVAAKMGRSFVACDAESLAVETTMARLSEQRTPATLYMNKPLSKLVEASKLPRFEVIWKYHREEIPGSDNELLRIELSEVKERRLSKDLREEDRRFLERVRKDSSLDFLQSWSIDSRFDGSTFCPQEIFIRKRKELPLCYETIVSAGEPVHLAMKFVDVLGQVRYEERNL